MEIVNEDGRLLEPSSSARPRVYDVTTWSLRDMERRVQRVDFSEQLKCLVSSEPDQLLARLTWCIDSGLADGAGKIASFQQALVSSEKFRRFEDFIRLNNGAVHPPKLCVDFTIFGFEVHISALSLAATKFVEILDAVELARVDGRSITIENSLALTPENEALAALLNSEHQFAKLMNIFNVPIPLSSDGLTEWTKAFLRTRKCALIVRGAQEVDQLVRTAQKFASVAVKYREQNVAPDEDRGVVSDIGSINKMVVICSTAMPRLVVTWLLTEPDAICYRCKPLNYLAYLLQQDHGGGLLQRLRESDLANDIQVVLSEEGPESSRRWTVFRVIFMLTSKGVEMKEQMVGALFAYLRHVRDNDLAEWIYQEAAMSCRLKYEFGSSQSLADRETLCRAILDYAPEDCIDGSHLMLQFDAQLISRTIARLLESPFNLILEGDFDISEFPNAEAQPSIGLIMKMPVFDEKSENWNFYRYSPNKFMPRVLTRSRESRFVENYPNVISKTESHRLWYQFRESNSPKVYCFINFAKLPAASLAWFVSAELASAILERSLLTRRTSEAGIDIQCTVTNFGITISIVAVNDSLDSFVEQVVRQIRRSEVSPDLFQECLTDLIESYHLRTTNAGLAENIFAQWHSGQLDLSKKIEAAAVCRIKDVAEVFRDMEKQLFRECFIYGSYTSNFALRTVRLIDTLGCGHSFQPSMAPALKGLNPESKSHPGTSSGRTGIALLYYHWGSLEMNNAFFLEVLSDFLNSRMHISDSTVYCMPRSRAGDTTGFTVELACDKDQVSRNCLLVERTLTQLIAELSDDQNEIDRVLSAAKNHFRRRRETALSRTCSLMVKEAHTHLSEILNATYRFGTCFDAENAINSLESGVFFNWLQESVASGFLKQPLLRVRVG